jgi:hypothetical protein
VSTTYRPLLVALANLIQRVKSVLIPSGGSSGSVGTRVWSSPSPSVEHLLTLH